MAPCRNSSTPSRGAAAASLWRSSSRKRSKASSLAGPAAEQSVYTRGTACAPAASSPARKPPATLGGAGQGIKKCGAAPRLALKVRDACFLRQEGNRLQRKAADGDTRPGTHNGRGLMTARRGKGRAWFPPDRRGSSRSTARPGGRTRGRPGEAHHSGSPDADRAAGRPVR